MIKSISALVLLGILLLAIKASNATDLNPNVVSRQPPPQLAPPSQQNLVMDPYRANQVNVAPYVPPTPVSSAQIDSVINTAVENAILHDERLSDTALTSTTQGGVVTLTGSVFTQAQKDIAVDVVKAVAGVREVKTDIIVQGL